MPAILVNDVSPVISYVATAAQTLFAVPFEFFSVQDIVVERAGVQLAYNATPVNNTQYSVVGANAEGGGSITLGGAGAIAGETIVVYRDIAIERLANYPETGPMAVRSLNAEQAKHIGMMQQLERDIGRGVTVPIGESAIDLPSAAERAEKVLTFDENGDPITFFSSDLLAGLTVSAGGVPAQTIEFTATSGQTVFNFPVTAAIGFVSVFLNGVRLKATDFVHVGATVTLNIGATLNDIVTLVGFSQAAVPDLTSLPLLAQPTGSSLVGHIASETGAVARTAQAKLRDNINVKDFGAVVDGTTNDTTTIQSAISATGQTQSPISFSGGKAYATNSLQNTYGTPIVNGKLVQPDAITGAYKVQTNSYAPDINGLMVGRENLAAWLLANNVVTPNNVYIFGDSTVEQNALYIPKAHGLFEYALWEAGINWVATVNRGVSGTSWSDLNAIPDLGANTKLIVIKYGINDAVKSNNLQTLAADARAKLTAIRAATNGNYYNLSILLMGPSSTYRPVSGQDATWYESLRNVYVQLAKEFDCAYFDTYAYLQSTRLAPNFWLDQIPPDQGGIHPTPDASWWIWYEGIKRFVIGEGTWSRNKSNHFWNRNGSAPSYTAFPTSQPQLYPMGLSVDRALVSNGWPADGTLLTLRGGSAGDGGEVRQELTTIETVPRRFMRTGVLLTWTQWTELNTAPTLLNSWTNKGGGYNLTGYMVHSDGFVELYGTLTGGTLGAAMFTLPTNARPAFAHLFVTAGGTGSGTAATITVFGDGNVFCSAASNATISLDGVRFRFGA